MGSLIYDEIPKNILIFVTKWSIMAGFVIRASNHTSQIEFSVMRQWDDGDMDVSVRTQYAYYGRTVSSVNTWSLMRSAVLIFFNELNSMYDNIQGNARLSSNDGDYIDLSMDEVGCISIKFHDGFEKNGLIHYSFQIDQSYLPTIIEEIKTIISANRK